MGITSSKLTNPLYSEKLHQRLVSIAAATAPVAMGNMTGWTLTVPVTGKYRVTAQCAINMVPSIPSTECGSYWQLAKDGVAVPGTWRAYLERTSTATSPTHYASLAISIILDLTAGEVITLQGDRHNNDTVVLFVSGSLFEMELVESVVPIATNVMEQYETGWIACSDWTNQLLGDTVSSNVAHNLDADLSDMIVKVMVSTDGSDGNSFEIRAAQSGTATVGFQINQVDNNTIQVVTSFNGVSILDGTNNVITLDTESWFYKIKVIKLATQYKAPAVQRYSTGWVANSDWTQTTLGDTPGGNVTHNLNAPLSEIEVRLLISTDGTDTNSFEPYLALGNVAETTGVSFYAVDNNTISVPTGLNGIRFCHSAGILLQLDTESWYYQVVVTKRYNTLTATVAPVMPSYDTGWVNCSDWTDQHLGTAVGGNVVHSLGYNLRELLVQVFISTDGTDNNSFEITMVEGSGGNFGFQVDQVDANNITVQTGASGIRFINGSGVADIIDIENWYYRVVVTKLQPVISVRNISEDYSTSETDTGKQWIDGKTIYRKVVNFGAMPNATLKNVAHGITTIDTLINIYGSAHNTGTGDRRPLPHVNISGAGSSIQMVVDNTNIGIHSGTTDRTALNECFITLEFTKV